MLSSSFDPYLSSEHIPSDPDIIFDITLTLPYKPAAKTLDELLPERSSAPGHTPSPVEQYNLDDEDTITVSLPEWPLSPVNDAMIIDDQAPSEQQMPFEPIDAPGSLDRPQPADVSQQYPLNDSIKRDQSRALVQNNLENTHELTEQVKTESSGVANGDESDYESPSEVHSIPYADDSEQDLDTRPPRMPGSQPTRHDIKRNNLTAEERIKYFRSLSQE